MPPVRACCPLCGRRVLTFVHHGRAIFEHHGEVPYSGSGTNQQPDRYAEPCVASGWLVEDEDRVA